MGHKFQFKKINFNLNNLEDNHTYFCYFLKLSIYIIRVTNL